MKLTARIACVSATVTTAALISAGGAHAQDDGSLLSLLDSPSVVLACFPSGQVGSHNQFTGTQNINCSQSATSTTAPGPGGGGVTGREVVVGEPVTAVPGNTVNAIATCPDGKVATGGGIVTLPSDADFTNEITYPDPNLPDVWLARAVNEGEIEGTVQAYAVCVDAAAP